MHINSLVCTQLYYYGAGIHILVGCLTTLDLVCNVLLLVVIVSDTLNSS